MIRNQWYVVLESNEVGKHPAGFIRLGERLVFWRDDSGKAICHLDRCAHRGASLAPGRVLRGGAETAPPGEPPYERAGGRIQCPFHGIEYDGSGRASSIPANGRAAPLPEGFRLVTYPTHEAHGLIWIWWAAHAEEEPAIPPPPPKFFDDIPESMSWSTRRDPWANHYSRSIENQLDMAHLPFVHHNTIGRGGRTVVDGPGIVFNEEGFFVYTYNRRDDGSPAKRVDQVSSPRPDSSQKLEFRFPNLWENYITEKLRIVAAFVPVDGENSILYLRFYQGFMRFPPLRSLVQAIGDAMNLVIAHQDRRIVNTQIPRGDGMGAGELLFPGDAAIMEYRKLRAEAKKGAGKP
jgi:phenylpropionate dioxygenase-like ring-hydroxylating dioxygenase large terminal subunit